jgi:hypothetical protein
VRTPVELVLDRDLFDEGGSAPGCRSHDHSPGR